MNISWSIGKYIGLPESDPSALQQVIETSASGSRKICRVSAKGRFFLNYFKPTAQTSILDIGASEKEYQENGNILEKQYPYPEKITALRVEEYKEL